MMEIIKVYLFLAVLACMIFSGCKIDPRYETAALLDNQTVEMAQKMTAHLYEKDIDVKSTHVEKITFNGSYADINADEGWVKPYFTFIPEGMFLYPNAPLEINGVILAKLKSKDKIDVDFNFVDNETQGTCGDVQRVIYAQTLDLLTDDEKEKYLTTGKLLSIIQDNSTDNPEKEGTFWLDLDPATMITSEGNNYFYEPAAVYVSNYDPIFQDGGDKRYQGVRYCKLLSHQAILSWMLTKSFQNDPVLLTKSPIVCTDPRPRITTLGSCLFHFPLAQSYYCSDYTGSEYTPEFVEDKKCAIRPDIESGASADPVYSPLPCSERTDEIEAYIPDYQGLNAYCAVHCGDTDEFIWNVYTENPEDSCIGYEIFYPED